MSKLAPPAVAILIATALAAVTATFCVIPRAHCDSLAAEPSESSPLSYRQVFVPADKPEVWPTDGHSLLPIQTSELQKLLRNLDDADQSVATSRSTRVSVLLRAELAGEQRLKGQGELHVETSGGRPEFLAWPNLSTRITNARWIGLQQGKAQSRNAMLGYWPHISDSNQRLQYRLYAPASGTLEFDFEVFAKLGVFEIELPAAVACQLTLTVRDGLRPVSERVVVRPTKTDKAENVWILQPLVGQMLTFGLTEVSARTELADKATASGQQDRASKSPTLFVSSDIDIELQGGGTETVTQLRLLTDQRLPDRLNIEVPGEVNILKIEQDGTPLAWQSSFIATDPKEDSARASSGKSVLKVELAQTETRRSTLSVHTWRQRSKESLSSDGETPEPWDVPWLTVPSATWTNGKAKVRISDELRLIDIPRCEGMVSRSGDVPESQHERISYDGPRRLDYQLLRTVPDLQLVTEVAKAQSPVALAQVCRVGDAEAVCEATVELSVIGTQARSQSSAGSIPIEPLRFSIRPPWIVDSVESVPANQVGSWQVKPDASGQQLVVQLRLPTEETSQQKPNQQEQRAETIASQRQDEESAENEADVSRAASTQVSPRLVIACRRQFASRSAAVPLAGLVPLATDGQTYLSSRLQISAAGANALELVQNQTDRGPTAASEFKSDLEIDLSSDRGRRLLKTASIQRTRRPTPFDAKVNVTLEPLPDAVRYRAAIEVTPVKNRTEAILCYFHQPLLGQLRWTNPSTGQPLDAARAPWLASGVATGVLGELWSVRSPLAAEGPLRVQVETLLPRQARLNIPLPMCPGARHQRGSVAILQVQGEPIWVNRSGLRARFSKTPNEATFDFDPAELGDNRQPVSMQIELGGEPDELGRSKRAAQLTGLHSVWLPHGQIVHAAQYRLSPGATSFRFQLPEAVELMSVTDHQGRQLSVSKQGQLTEATLPTSNRPVLKPSDSATQGVNENPPRDLQLRVVYSSKGNSSSRVAAPVLPRSEARVGRWNWTLLTPEDWSLASPPSSVETDYGNGGAFHVSWRKRLFGPLAQTTASPFNPFSADDWINPIRLAATTPQKSIRRALRKLSPRGQRWGGSDQSLAGWRSFQFAGTISSPAPVRLVNVRSSRVGSLAMQIGVTIAVAGWFLQRRERSGRLWLGVAAAVAVAAALLVPSAWVPWASAVWFGVLTAAPLAWLLDLIHKRFRKLTATDRAIDSVTIKESIGPTRTAVAPSSYSPLLLLSLTAALIGPCTAAAKEEGATTEVIPAVIVPVDNEGSPVGDKRYVSEPFLKRLLVREKTLNRGQPTDVIIQGASYRGDLQSAQLATVERGQTGWAMTLRVLALRPGATVFLPLELASADWEETVSVDGVPSLLLWESEGCRFVIAEAGPAIATIRFEPRINREDQLATIDFAVPKIPSASLSLQVPETLDDVDVEQALLPPTLDSGDLDARLKADGRITVRWQDNLEVADQVQPQVDLLQWVHIGSVTGGAKETSQVPVAMQVRLTSDTVPNEPIRMTIPVGWYSAEDRELTEIAFDLTENEPLAEKLAAEPIYSATHWLLADRKTAVGIIWTPAIKCSNAEVRRKIAAVSVGSDYRASAELGGGIRSLSPSDFITQWRAASPEITTVEADTRVTPQIREITSKTPEVLAAAVLPVELSWPLNVALDTGETGLPDQDLEIEIGTQSLTYHWEINRLPSNNGSTLLPINVPTDLQVTSVKAIHGSADTTKATDLSWARPTADRFIVYLPSDPTAIEGLRVIGRRPHATDSEGAESRKTVASFPLMALADHTDSVVNVSLLRTEAVLASLNDVGSAEQGKLDKVAVTALASGARLLAQYQSSLKERVKSAHVWINDLQYQVSHFTSYSAGEQQVFGEWSARIDVQAGSLGRLPIELAEQDGVQLVSPENAQLRKSQFLGSTRWEVWFANPVPAGESIDVRLACSVELEKAGPATTLAAPLANPYRSHRSTAFVAIARETGSTSEESVRWASRGLVPASEKLAESLLNKQREWRLFRIEESNAQVVAQSRIDRSQKARVALAEHRLLPQPGVENFLTSCFWVQPRGTGGCLLELPPGASLVDVAIDGRSILYQLLDRDEPQQATRYEIDFLDDRLSQRVEVNMVCGTDSGSRSVPKLLTATGAGLVAEKTIWLVKDEGKLGVQTPPDFTKVSERFRTELHLRALYSLLPGPQPSAEQADDKKAWRTIWQGYVRQAINQLAMVEDSRLPSLANDQLPLDADAEEYDISPAELIAACKEWLGVDGFSAESEGPVAPVEPDLNDWAIYLASDASPAAMPQVVYAVDTDFRVRLLLAAGLAGLLLIAAKVSLSLDLKQWVYQYRHPLAGLGGLVWWLLLEPSIVGLVILLAAAVGQIRNAWLATPARSLAAGRG